MKPTKNRLTELANFGKINEDQYDPYEAKTIAKDILDIFMEAQNESGEIDHEAVEEEIHQLLLKRR
tara:strand:+ start:204 stop:401 length:198 start_codon:yes stop_codon:yes gene_type:complete